MDHLYLPYASNVELETIKEDDDNNAETVTDSQSTSSKISGGIMFASEWMAWGIDKGAEVADTLISYGSDKLRGSIQPDKEAKYVDPLLQTSMLYVSKTSHLAMSASSYAVDKLGKVTTTLGHQAAPYIRTKAEELFDNYVPDGTIANFDDVVNVASSSLQGFCTVYTSLKNAGRTVLKTLANETVSLVNHKYGCNAGQLTESTMSVMGNMSMTGYNLNAFGMTAVAKHTAKDTGRAVLCDMSNQDAALVANGM